jgi:hypothetical protein
MPQGGHYQPANGVNHKRKTAELGGKLLLAAEPP